MFVTLLVSRFDKSNDVNEPFNSLYSIPLPNIYEQLVKVSSITTGDDVTVMSVEVSPLR